MAMNIDHFRIDEMKELVIPLKAIQSMPNINTLCGDGVLAFEGWSCEQFLMEGKQNPADLEMVNVDNIWWHGLNSAEYWHPFRKMMNHSKGTLKVLVVWEGCDVQRYQSVDGYQITESF